MKRYFVIILCLVFSFGLATIVSLPTAFSQEEAQVMVESIAGEITSTNIENSTVTLKAMKDEVAQACEETVVKLDNSTVISKSGVAVGVADLAIGDKAKVEYTKNENGELIAVSVVIE